MARVLEPIASRPRARVTVLAAVTIGLAALALVSPLTRAEFPAARVGVFLAGAAAIELIHGLRRSTAAARRQATSGAVISMLIALLLINAPYVAAAAMRVLVAGWFAIDAARNAIAALRRRDRERTLAALAAAGNFSVVLLLVLGGGWTATWLIAIAGAMRILGIAWNIAVAPVHTTTDADESVVSELGLAEDPDAARIAAEIEAAEVMRAPIDRGWIMAFVATLFAIHIGRMQVDLTILGLVSPAVAVIGDMTIAVLAVLLIVNPLYLLWRGPTRWLERRAWRWYLPQAVGQRLPFAARLTGAWLRWRMRYAIRLRAARYSVPAVVSQSLQTGLPFAAILAATVPVWGMSWYFDTENWAAGMWNSWAESRTDPWRDAMVRAVVARGGAADSSAFAVVPPGVDVGDFSFVVIGDPGEGDASQHVLRDQLLSVSNSGDVRFVVLASDVVYPTGAMKDYEAKFWLPFKGVTKPVYAIPGNHDWYDALEGFNATFLQPDAARAAIRARAESDMRVGSTTDARIEQLVSDAARLRRAYGVATGFQRAPFFEVQTPRFALVAIDTGVLRSIDAAQSQWLDGALDRAAGKMTMAIVGHPFFAGGHDVTVGNQEFTALRERLRRRGVSIVMAGDTHDLEYYRESGTAGASPDVHHFVNGGGGAYLSFGTALDWPASVPVAQWAYYPDRDAVTGKIQAMTPWWKRPAWWWTAAVGAWPFTPEWLSAAFDYNVAPFFQSFVEVKVEPSSNRVRVIPYGVNGRLTWNDLTSSDALRAGAADGATVEWVVEMR